MSCERKTCGNCAFYAECRIRMTIDNALDIFEEYFEKKELGQTSIHNEVRHILASRCIYYKV